MRRQSLLLLLTIALFGFTEAEAQDELRSREKRIVFSGMAFTTLPFGQVKKVASEESTQIDGLTINRKRHDLRKPILIQTELCSEMDGALEPITDTDFLYRVKSYVSYNYAGKTFAYEVDYDFIDAETRDEIGAATSAHYVDAQGDGTFAIRCVKDFKLESVPMWIRNLAR